MVKGVDLCMTNKHNFFLLLFFAGDSSFGCPRFAVLGLGGEEGVFFFPLPHFSLDFFFLLNGEPPSS